MGGFKKVKALSLVSVLALLFGACSQPSGGDKGDKEEKPPAFVPVEDISGVPTGGVKGTPIDLTVASVVPAGAANKSIVWSVKDPGRTVLARGVTGQIFTPDSAGTITITAIIANGKGPGETFVKDFILAITDTHVAVTNITGVPLTGTAGTAISLAGTAVVPTDATNKTIIWAVAADSPVKGTLEGNSVMVKGAGNLKLAALVMDGEEPGRVYTRNFIITVTGAEDSGLTGDVSFTLTEKDSSGVEFDLFAWTGQGTASQNWSIAVVEQRKTYFGVRKSAAQTITVGGTGASLVTRHTSGTVDGSAIGDTLNVFTVDTSAFDLMFLGGSRSFTLTVSEAGKESVTVNVTVSVRPYKTGVAVFKVTRPVGDPGITKEMTPAQAEEWAVSGSLERVPPEDIKEWKFPEKSTDLGYWGEAQGARLLDALAWVDQDPEKSGEYLIRVEKSEALPPCQLTSKKTREDAGEDVTIRLRSAGGEQIISFNGDNAITGRYYNSAIYIYASSPDGLINLNQGHEGAGSRDYGMLTLGLEKNISLRGFRRAGDHGVRNVLRLNNFSKLVMLEGSKIYGHDADGSYSSEVIYCYYVKNSLLFNPLPPGLYMFGGAIMDNLTAERGTVFFSTFRINHVFVKKGGVITGNTYKGQPHNKITFYSDSPEGRILEIEPDVEYSYPDFNEE